MRALLWLLLALPVRAAELARAAAAPAPVPAFSGLSGLDLALTPPRLETLRQVLTDEPKGMSADGFRSYVGLEPAAMAQAMAAQKEGFEPAANAMAAMYSGMVRVARRDDMPFDERAALTMILAQRYSTYLGALLEEPGFHEPTRVVARRMRERLDDGSAARGLLYADRLARRARGLARAVEPSRLDAMGRDPAPWSIPAPVPRSERTRKPGRRRILIISMPKLARFLDSLSAKLEQGLGREGGESLWKAAERARRQAQRVGETSIRKTLLKGKDHRVSGVPLNRGLRLIPKRGGFLLKARFKSSIADRRVWRVVKDSIEQEWRGRFNYAGKTYFLRTEVSIEPLDEGEQAGEDFLILREGQEAASHAGNEGITLTRDFAYLTPAHEFGHVVGLPDEYKEVYDFDAMTTRHESPLASLMASSHLKPGLIRPRHLKLAYQLLRRRRLALPEKPTP